MIIPTADFDPMFAVDHVPFRSKMVQYIKQEFSDVLGPHIGLLETDEDLERLWALYAQPPVAGIESIRKAA